MNILEKADIFGIQIGLNYKQDNVYKTAFGGLTTLVFIAMMTIFFFNQVVTLIQKSQVNYTTSPSVETEPGIIELDTNKYMIAVKIDQDDFISRPYYNLTFEQRHYIRYENGTYIQNKTPIQLEPCTWDHFKGLPNLQYDWQKAYDLQNLDDFLCLQRNQTYLIGGKFENKDFYHLKFLVTQCKNSTDTTRKWKPVCKTSQEIKDKQNDEDTRIDFLFTNYNLNPEQPDSTSQIYLESMFFTFQPHYMYSTANIFITQKTMTTDNSLFPFEDNSDEIFPIYNNGDYKQQYSVGDYQKYSEIFFLRSNFNTQINRAYQKIDQVISYIGGFCQMFLLLFAFVVRTYNSYHYQFELINKLYDFDLNEIQNDNDQHPNKTNPTKQRRTSSFQAKHNCKINPIESSNQIDANQQYKIKAQKIDKSAFQTEGHHQNLRYSIIDLSPCKLAQSQQFEQEISKNFEKNERTINNDQNYQSKILRENISPTQSRASPMKRINLEKLQFSTQQSASVLPLNYTSSQERNNPYGDEPKRRKQKTLLNKSVVKEQESNISKSLQNLQQQQTNQNDHLENYAKTPYQNEENDYNNNINAFNEGEYFNQALQITSEQALKIKKGVKFYNAQQFLEREITNYVKKENPMKLSLQYFINSITFGKFCNTPVVQILNKANDMLSKDIDIYELIRSIKELDKLKKLLLNKEQESLFNFFPKPVISLKEDDAIPKIDYLKRSQTNNKVTFNKLIYQQKVTSFKQIALVIKAINRFKMNLKRNQHSQIKKLYDAYVKIIHTNDPNSSQAEINERLIELLGKDLVKIFEATRRIYVKTEEQIYRETMLAIQQNQNGEYYNQNYKEDVSPIGKQIMRKPYFDNQVSSSNSESKKQEDEEQQIAHKNQQVDENVQVEEQGLIEEKIIDLHAQQQQQMQTDQNISVLNATSLPFINNFGNAEQTSIVNINNNEKKNETEIYQQDIQEEEEFNVYQSYSLNKNVNSNIQDDQNQMNISSFQIEQNNTPVQIIQKAKAKKNNYVKSPKSKKQK
ncbi:transmembrane protein, putative (macronuclear) [Tetrahymena thermophila SB210]|uniref:Transmembrane protein, putative n=1 Tax=Tetrahymena thermophila (strain SB210) TaxID=312017 RepID=Q22F26_TETTS|nr:transmembrane protein, putative [Tetrahymena thermophila SB210]EAR83849.2 transmembrane protein, putative [Tetrahymena thermophila SB210]|eukprot:XP_001031512.2 transmembrane protein, putative [Tetrahymena thermophila SB210]